jgi:hypothetical protein
MKAGERQEGRRVGKRQSVGKEGIPCNITMMRGDPARDSFFT